MKRLWSKLWKFFECKKTTITHYEINGKEVSEAEWYANGGYDLERELDKLSQKLDELAKKRN